jgi:putative hydrolase of the HAD superfamily
VQRPALIFDFGNVFAHFGYGPTCARLARYCGVSTESLFARLEQVRSSPVVREYERGAMSSEAFAQRVCEALSLDVPFREFAPAFSEIFELNDPVVQLVAGLKKRGYTLVLGSNTNALHAGQFRNQFAEALAHFDQLVLSFEIGMMKPEPGFYLACAQAALAPPGSCLFIDDLVENVEGATAAGLVGIHYRDFDSLSAELRALGVPM